MTGLAEESDRVARHASVVNPGGRLSINPYYLGYSILVDINVGMPCMLPAVFHDGPTKAFEVRRTEDDTVSPQLPHARAMEKLDLFTYGRRTHPPDSAVPSANTS
jgi:hypothetical protein